MEQSVASDPRLPALYQATASNSPLSHTAWNDAHGSSIPPLLPNHACAVLWIPANQDGVLTALFAQSMATHSAIHHVQVA
jgi:hypothetical protein